MFSFKTKGIIKSTVDNAKSFCGFTVSKWTYIVLLMLPFMCVADRKIAKQTKKYAFEKIICFWKM